MGMNVSPSATRIQSIDRNNLRSDSFLDANSVPEQGCLSIVVLGASGDLAKKKTFPALFNLYRQVCQIYFDSVIIVWCKPYDTILEHSKSPNKFNHET